MARVQTRARGSSAVSAGAGRRRKRAPSTSTSSSDSSSTSGTSNSGEEFRVRSHVRWGVRGKARPRRGKNRAGAAVRQPMVSQRGREPQCCDQRFRGECRGPTRRDETHVSPHAQPHSSKPSRGQTSQTGRTLSETISAVRAAPTIVPEPTHSNMELAQNSANHARQDHLQPSPSPLARLLRRQTVGILRPSLLLGPHRKMFRHRGCRVVPPFSKCTDREWKVLTRTDRF